MSDMGALQPWDRHPGESAKAYEAFAIYRDMGSDRTTRGVAESLGKSDTLISGWSSKHDWVRRVSAWDSIPGRAVKEAYDAMAERIAAQHERVATKLMQRLEVHLDLLPEGKVPSQNWSIAHGAGRQGHQLATDLARPADTRKAEIAEAIENLIHKLAGEDD